jgi:uncharacterized YccA/Bax inhibitor family protein
MNYTKWIARTGLLMALTIVIQMFGFPPFITGPLVNMMLFISTYLLGGLGGALIGSLTPWIALLRGILLPPLAPMVPFIIAGNITLVVIYHLLQKKNKYLGIGLASLLKFTILTSGVRFLVNLPPKIAKVMQFPQLLTALAGGLLALTLIKILRGIIGEDSLS